MGVYSRLKGWFAGHIETAMRKAKSERGSATGMGNPDYSSLRVVSGHYIERDVHALIDEINQAGGLAAWSKGKTESSDSSESASGKPRRSSKESE